MRPIHTKTFLITCLFFLFTATVGLAQYCIPNPTYGTTYDAYIDGVKLNEINNTGTGGPADTNYTFYRWGFQRANLELSTVYNLTITGSPLYTNMHYVAWIDYNKDGDFYDPNEKLGEYITTSANQTFTISFTTPTGIDYGETRMRVRCVYNVTDPDPCTDYYHGETEDYLVYFNNFSRNNLGFDAEYATIGFFNWDKDNDLDILNYNGTFESTSIFFYYNSNGTYYKYDYLVSPPAPLIDLPAFALSDLNNDNYLDYVLMGEDRSDNSPHTTIYLKSGSYHYQTDMGITELDWGNLACADLNNDGLEDLIITGYDANEEHRTLIYQNALDTFLLVEHTIPGLYRGAIKCADYDTDGDIDILISGTDEYGVKHTEIYRNDNHWQFTNVFAQIPQTNTGIHEWGDYDADGDMDIVIHAPEDIRICKNNGGNEFEPIIVYDDWMGSVIKWADMDNDGLLDIVGDRDDRIIIFLNNGDDTFTESVFYIPSLGNEYKYMDIGDYNYDRKLDILANADSLVVYENHTPNVNQRPSVPTSLSSIAGRPEYYSVLLSWDASTDNQTPQNGLTYNLRVGTTPGGTDIVSPESTSNTMFLPTFGNVFANTSYALNNLEPGTYYWSVQAVDNSFTPSLFASEGTFIINPPLDPTSFFADGTFPREVPGFDYDMDSDIDVFISYSGTIYLYEQTSPESFTPHTFSSGSALIEVDDINVDNRPDIMFSSTDTIGFFINQSAGVYTKILIDTIPASASTIKDFDNDGDQDLLLYNTNYYLYENTGSMNFIRKMLPFYDTLTYAKLIAEDIDNDGDYDFIISGTVGDNPFGFGESPGLTLVFKNEGSLNFELHQSLSPGLGASKVMLSGFSMASIHPQISWNDFNHDGFIDLLMCGRDIYQNNYTIVYLNNTDGYFERQQYNLRPSPKYNANWFDYNADGNIDLILPKTGSDIDYHVYLNNGNSDFEGFSTRLDSLTNIFYTDNIDINSDNQQDFIYSLKFTMGDNYRFETYIDENTGNLENAPPQVPSGLRSTLDSLTVNLAWDHAIDDLTGNNGVFYNIWIGTGPATANIVSPLSDLTTGKPFYNHKGNCGTRNNYQLHNLPVGTYYWSVQSIDNGRNNSTWAPVQVFNVSSINVDILADTACAESPTSFTDNTAIIGDDEILSWSWDFGDGTNSTLQNPKHTYSSGGIYTVKLTVKSELTIQTDSLDVTVLHRPQSDFIAPAVCHNTSTMFTDKSNTSNNTVIAYHWSFGDEGTENDIGSTAHLYAQPGLYNVQLIIDAANGCSDTVSHNTIVYANPSPVVSLPNIDGKQYNSQICENDSTILVVNRNPEYSYQWLFDGGNLFGETDTALVVKDMEPGPYTYGVRVTNPLANCTGTDDQGIVIKYAPDMPLIVSENSVTVACEGDSILLTTPLINDEFRYYWELDDYTQPGNQPEFYATDEGVYSLRVETEELCSSKSYNIISLTFNPSPEIESISIISKDSSFCYGSDITLSTTFNPEYDYHWRKDNDSLEIASTNYIVVQQSGTYTIVAENTFDCKSSFSIDVNLFEKPPMFLRSETVFVCPEETISLEPEIFYAQYKYQWLRNGVNLSGKTDPVLTDELMEGDYKLVCTNQGCDSVSKEISVKYISEIEKPQLVVFGPNVWYIGCKNDSAAEYRWYYNGDLLLNQTSHMCMAGLNYGTYRLEISDGSRCRFSSEEIEIPNDNFKSGYSPEFNLELSISPNPNKGQFFVLLEGMKAGTFNMDLVDISGKQIFSEQIIKKGLSEKVEIVLPLNPGIYFLKVSDKANIWTKEIAIE